MPEKVELTLKPSGEKVKPEGNPEEPMKSPRLFCTNKDVARSFLREIVLYLGAYADIKAGRAKPEEVAQITEMTLQFFGDIGDKLMLDSGLTQDDLNAIAKEIAETGKAHAAAQEPKK